MMGTLRLQGAMTQPVWLLACSGSAQEKKRCLGPTSCPTPALVWNLV